MRIWQTFVTEELPSTEPTPGPLMSPSTLPDSFGVSTSLLEVTLNLALVLGAIVLLAWIVKRVQGLDHGGAGQLRVTASLALGPKERLLVVEVGEQQILLGASHAGIHPLHVLDTPLSVETPEDVPFRDKLLQSLKGATS